MDKTIIKNRISYLQYKNQFIDDLNNIGYAVLVITLAYLGDKLNAGVSYYHGKEII